MGVGFLAINQGKKEDRRQDSKTQHTYLFLSLLHEGGIVEQEVPLLSYLIKALFR
jgi:hypothetical protein